jgi:hypothetical protein
MSVCPQFSYLNQEIDLIKINSIWNP